MTHSSGIELEMGIDLNSKLLTNFTAYFLGMLISANEQIVINGRRYWIAPVRHNPQEVQPEDLERHYNNVKTIARNIELDQNVHMRGYFQANSVRLPSFTSHKGFVTLVPQIKDQYSMQDLINDVSGVIKNASQEIKRSFLVGAFDGRSSYDKTYKMVSMDGTTVESMDLFEELLGDFGLDVNINGGFSARKRENPNAKPRKTQIRVKDPLKFLKKIGYVSDTRINKAISLIDSSLTIVKQDNILPGLKDVK